MQTSQSVPSSSASRRAPLDTGSESNLDENALDLLSVCDEIAAIVETTPGFSVFTHLVINKRHYRNLGARCACAKLRLFRFADDAYSVCEAHGIQSLGYFVRDYSTPAVRR